MLGSRQGHGLGDSPGSFVKLGKSWIAKSNLGTA
jgi:hypothetical protein